MKFNATSSPVEQGPVCRGLCSASDEETLNRTLSALDGLTATQAVVELYEKDRTAFAIFVRRIKEISHE